MVRVACADPDAVVQPRKDGVYCPGYKPAILVEEHSFIVGLRVDPSSEQLSLEPLLAQYERHVGGALGLLLLDGGFKDLQSLRFLEEQEIRALCTLGLPPRSSPRQLRMRQGRFDKSEFSYDPARDEYTCPTGKKLVLRGHGRRAGQQLRQYVGVACGACPERARCTSGKTGRMLNRYEADEYRERMAEKIAQTEARALLKKRSVLVEPPFAVMKERFGMRRFRRRGARRVAIEFALWCLTHNVWRALPLLRAKAEKARPPSPPAIART